MAQIRLAICQIPLLLEKNSRKIYNLESHAEKVEACLNFAENKEVDYIIFPEYSFDPIMTDLYLSKSNTMTIIGGSYISEDNYNVTIIAKSGKIYSYNKINLSPYENSIIRENRLNSGEDYNLYLQGSQDIKFGVLTCYDYYELSRNVAEQELTDGSLIDIIFSPTCNNNPRLFHDEANATHHRRDNYYSIICNVSSLKKIDGSNGSIVSHNYYGGSSIFGLYASVIKEELVELELSDTNYINMILNLKEGSKILITSLEVPYYMHRRRSREYTENPSSIELFEINENNTFDQQY
jgi:predicted amidohydrolase